jgi:ketosteroid isomerase-like protein
MSPDDEDGVRAANDAFYRAFRDRDLPAMDALWARRAPVACAHPGMEVIAGRDEVMRSWRGILGHADAPRLAHTRAVVHLLGDAAYVTCVEGAVGEPPALVATNVFVREDGGWRMVHHQAAPLTARRGPPPPPAKRSKPDLN